MLNFWSVLPLDVVTMIFWWRQLLDVATPGSRRPRDTVMYWPGMPRHLVFSVTPTVRPLDGDGGPGRQRLPTDRLRVVRAVVDGGRSGGRSALVEVSDGG